jgi:hypothetical protein
LPDETCIDVADALSGFPDQIRFPFRSTRQSFQFYTMNQTFNFHRFGLMLKLDLAEKGRNYLFIAALLVVLMVALMLPIAIFKQYNSILEVLQILALFMIVLLGSRLYTSNVFNQYARSSTGIAALMTPASAFEKLLSALVINLVFIVPFIFLYWKIHFSTIEYANSQLKTTFHYNRLPDDVVQYLTGCYFLIQGSVFLGSIYFRKASYIKTVAIAVSFLLLSGIFQNMLAYQFTSNAGHIVTYPLSGWKIWYFNTAYNSFEIFYPAPYRIIVYTFPLLMLLSLWFVAYVRLKEI